MTGITHYGAFLVAGILLNLTPGNDTLYILSQSLARGKQAGIYSALGIGTGSVVHTLLAAFGLSLIVARSLLVFTLVKYIGAAYLVYLGIALFRDSSRLTKNIGQTETRRGHGKTYRNAVLTNISNPKVALFYIAFLPQFIEPSHRQAVIPFLALGLTFTLTGTLWCLVLATCASGMSSRLRTRPWIAGALNKVSGTILAGLGVKLALTQGQ